MSGCAKYKTTNPAQIESTNKTHASATTPQTIKSTDKSSTQPITQKAQKTAKPNADFRESTPKSTSKDSAQNAQNAQKSTKTNAPSQSPQNPNKNITQAAKPQTKPPAQNPPPNLPPAAHTATSKLAVPLPLELSYNELAKSSPRSDGSAILHLKKDNQQGFQLIHIYNESGEILASLSFKNRQLHGISKIYKNGEVVKEVPYQNGILDGEVVSILGNLRTTQIYKNSKKEGASTIYRNGAIIGKKHYKNDILNGENLFFDAQNVAVKTAYINGRKNGNSSGYVGKNLVFLQNYVDDFLSGEAKTYGQNGILKIARFYTNGVLDGEEIVYDYPSQKPLHKALHKNGVLISPYQNYDKEQVYFSIKPLDFANALRRESSGGGEVWHYPNGQIAFTKNGNKIATYYPNGVLASEFEIVANGANGSTYNQNGVRESKISYSPNAHIQWLYNADGKTLRTKNEKQRGKNILQTYKNGVLSKEIITIEGEDLTIYRVFFGGANGQRLQAELYEKDKKVVGGKRYDTNGRVIFSYNFRSEDILFDEIFTYSAQARRAKILN